jgi:TPR repeat protein
MNDDVDEKPVLMQSTELQFATMIQATKDILVGYVEEDRDRAQLLIAAVKKAGLSPTAVIFDGIAPDDDLLQRFETTHCFVVLWSQAAARSSAVKELTSHAIQAWWLARLVLLTLDDAPLPTGLRDVPTTPLTESASDLVELMARISKIANESATASRMPKRKIATFVILGLLLALGSGTAGLLYRSSHNPSPQPKQLQDFGAGLLIQSPQNFAVPLLSGGQTETSDEREAARLYKFAADKGNSDAQLKLASFYEFGRGGLPKDYGQAVHLYKLSADQGNAAAQLQLGAIYELGRIGVQQDDEQARHYYQLSADQGNAEAQYELGRFYEFGRGGLPEDYGKAERWYRSAAEQGHVNASYRLANLLSNDADTQTGALRPVGFGGHADFPWPLVISLFTIIAIICGVGLWLHSKRHRASAKLAYTVMSVSKDTKPMRGTSSQVFVSYSRTDCDVVDQLVAQIEKLGYTVWIDREEQSAQRYAASIVAAIRKARLVALMCSQHSVASDQVVREVYVAGDYKKPFVIFQLDTTEFPDEFLYFLSGYPRISAADVNIARLRAQIEKTMAGGSSTLTNETRRPGDVLPA